MEKKIILTSNLNFASNFLHCVPPSFTVSLWIAWFYLLHPFLTGRSVASGPPEALLAPGWLTPHSYELSSQGKCSSPEHPGGLTYLVPVCQCFSCTRGPKTRYTIWMFSCSGEQRGMVLPHSAAVLTKVPCVLVLSLLLINHTRGPHCSFLVITACLSWRACPLQHSSHVSILEVEAPLPSLFVPIPLSSHHSVLFAFDICWLIALGCSLHQSHYS